MFFRLDNDSRTLHSVYGFVLVQHLVVLGESDQEYKSGHILKAVNPLLTFTPKKKIPVSSRLAIDTCVTAAGRAFGLRHQTIGT